ncbi:MAG TPA: regulatory protein RecX [Arenimonas sp.]|nr:regulatory protein RecX [Arenimonas sp.]
MRTPRRSKRDLARAPEDDLVPSSGARSAPDPYQQAIGLLARREYSRKALQRKLDARGADPESTGQALDRLAEQGWQSDTRFAEAFARTRALAGYGPLRIRAELAQQAVPDAQIDSALEACETDWRQSAVAQIQGRSRFDIATGPAGWRKAVEFLMRRGFSRDDAYAAARGTSRPEPGEDAE